jgi:hypothetical protein
MRMALPVIAPLVAILAIGCGTPRFTPYVAKKTGPPVAFATTPEFAEAAVRNGVVATRQQCDAIENAVWAQTEADQACLRYWAAGFSKTSSNRAVVYFEGDYWSYTEGLLKGYREMTTDRLKADAESWTKQIAAPYVFFARPGVFGSSGDHMQRRRPTESRLNICRP